MSEWVSAEPPLAVERRMTVHGWKVEAGKRCEFSSVSHVWTWSSVAYELARIGEENLPDWQPHITAVTVEARYITPWHEIPIGEIAT